MITSKSADFSASKFSPKPGSETYSNPSNQQQRHQSRRRDWLKGRWRNAIKSVMIGFGHVDETLEEDVEESNLDLKNNDGEKDTVAAVDRHHIFGAVAKGVDVFGANHTCGRCAKSFEANKTTGNDVFQCQNCSLLFHASCKSLDDRCEKNSTRQRPKFDVRGSQDSLERESNRTSSRHHLFSGQSSQKKSGDVDPVYLALKRGNKMASASQRKTSGKSDKNESSQSREQSAENLAGRSNSQQDNKLQCSSPMTSTVSLANKNTNNCDGNIGGEEAECQKNDIRSAACMKPILGQVNTKLGSAPNLLLEKSVETPTPENLQVAKKPTLVQPGPPKQSVRRAPKLVASMKSFSLDCPEPNSSVKKGSPAGTKVGNLLPNRHAFRVPPCKYNSFESDDTVQSSNSGSPCPNSYCGSSIALPSNSYAVTHAYHAKFPEEIDLRVGERVLVVDNSDQDWWQGHNVTGRLGIFPSTCVAHIHLNEKTMQVVQNVCLWVGNKNFRLYRDQVVFARTEDQDFEKLIAVRTEHDHQVNCPEQYLTNLDASN